MKKRNLKNEKIFLNDLYLFYRYFIASDFETNLPAPHIKILAKYLTNLKLGTHKKRLAVSMPPTALKKFNGDSRIPLMANLPEP